MRIGLLFRWQSFWIGAHYARTYRRLCINIVPMVTVWIAFRGGVTPREEREASSRVFWWLT